MTTPPVTISRYTTLLRNEDYGGVAAPRYETELPEGGDSWVNDILAEAEALGLQLMPWQIQAAELIGALTPDGLPRFKVIVITVPRQSGKTTLAKVVLSARAKRFDTPQQLYITAQTRLDAASHVEMLGNELGDRVKMRMSIGSERLTWENGSTLEVIAPNPTGAHGKSIDFMLLDEAWAIQAHVMGAVLPATVARPYSQLLFISTQGTLESEVLNTLTQQGREGVDDPDTGIAILEYSASQDSDTFNEALWPEFMPALGYTQRIEDIRLAMASLSPSAAIRAFGNRVTTTLVSIFQQEDIDAAWRIMEKPTRFVLGIDVNSYHIGASLTSAHPTDAGNIALRVIDSRLGTPQWLPDELDRILQRREVEAVAVDFGGPARQIQSEIEAVIERHRTSLVDVSGRDHAAYTLAFDEALRDRRVAIEKSEPIISALGAAQQKTLGDLWVISRSKMSTDASPLISGILAFGVQTELNSKPREKPLMV